MHRNRPTTRTSHPAAVALLLASVGLAFPACAASADGTADQSAAGDIPAVVAEVGGKPITLSDLEASLSAQLTKLDNQRRDLLEKGLERLVEQRLIEAEAEPGRLRLDLLDLERALVGEHRVVQLPELALVVGAHRYLANQRRTAARGTLVASLRSKYPTRIHLEPSRAEIATEGSPAKGPADAPVTIVEFSDFQCPYCSRINPVLNQAKEAYGDQVRVVFRHFPLSFHQQAQKAAEASMCANDQGKFWELHDAMFADQRALQVEQIKAKAAGLGLATPASTAASTFSRCVTIWPPARRSASAALRRCSSTVGWRRAAAA
jgi:protein-disulfide isomerase